MLASFIFMLHLSSKAQWSYDSVSFEYPTNKIVINNPESNMWQIGQPSKSLFNASHGGIKAILTDTTHFYPPNDTSSFIFVIQNPYTWTCFTSMEFWHKYDMDTIGDMGLIDASYDGGNTWVSVTDTINLPWGSDFWWDPDFHVNSGSYTQHPVITNGASDGWILSRFNWQWFIPVVTDSIIINPDSLMIRFTFISDSLVKNKEGWMIDDILVSSAEWQICSSDKRKEVESEFSVFPNPFQNSTRIQSTRMLRQASMNLYHTSGKRVLQQHIINGNSINLQRDGLAAGLYLLQIIENNRPVFIKKLLIQD